MIRRTPLASVKMIRRPPLLLVLMLAISSASLSGRINLRGLSIVYECELYLWNVPGSIHKVQIHTVAFSGAAAIADHGSRCWCDARTLSSFDLPVFSVIAR